MKLLLSVSLLIWTVCSAVYADQTGNYEIYAKLQQGPGNLTITPDGRFIMSLHQFYEPRHSVVELLPDNTLVPFPNQQLNDRTNANGLKLDSVLGIKSDANGVVWMLDNGMRSKVTPKLVAWDTRSNQLHRVIELPKSVAPDNTFVNDLAVDLEHQRIFISDPAGGDNAALIVVNLQTGVSKRVLEGHQSVVPENIDLVIDSRPLSVKSPSGQLLRPHIGVNPITEDVNNEWVYFGAMHGRSLYRIPSAVLADEQLDDQLLAGKVHRYSFKPISDGIAIDHSGNIYMGELAKNALGTVTNERRYKRLAQSPDLSWVDSITIGPDNKLYAIANKLHLSGVLNGGDAVSKPPYYLIRMNVQ